MRERGLYYTRIFPVFIVLFVALPIFNSSLFAGEPELDRPVVSLLPARTFELWFQYDEFSKGFDIMNYSGKVGASTRLDRFRSYILGGKYVPSSDMNIRYNVSISNTEVTRTSEPSEIKTGYLKHDIRLQRIFWESRKFLLAVEGGYVTHNVDDTSFTRFETGNVLVQSSTGEPVVTVKSGDSAYVFALRGVMPLLDYMNLNLGLEGRWISAKTSMESNLFDDPVVGDSLLAEAAKLSSWKERNILFTASLDWAPFEKYGLVMQAIYYQISRSGYISRANTPDYNSNLQLDGYLFWHFVRRATLYIHGRLSQHYVLGGVPFVYNARSQHLFKHQYGYLSMGIAIGY